MKVTGCCSVQIIYFKMSYFHWPPYCRKITFKNVELKRWVKRRKEEFPCVHICVLKRIKTLSQLFTTFFQRLKTLFYHLGNRLKFHRIL